MRTVRWFAVAALAAMAMGAVELAGADQLAAGTYKGAYVGGAGGGDFHLTLKPGAGGAFTAEVGFTVMGEEVAGKITSLKVDGAKIEMAYDFDLQGATLQSAAKGTLTGKTLEGTYTTTADGAAVDQGTWKTTAQ